MEQLFAELNHIFSFVIPLSDFFWDFPTNIAWYKAIPVLGNFSLAVICLFGAGLFFTFRTEQSKLLILYQESDYWPSEKVTKQVSLRYQLFF